MAKKAKSTEEVPTYVDGNPNPAINWDEVFRFVETELQYKAKIEFPVTEYLRESTKRDLEFLANHCHKLSGAELLAINLLDAFSDLNRRELYCTDEPPF